MKQSTVLYLSLVFFVTLCLWGLYSFLVYLGVPVHGSVLLHGDKAGALAEFCAYESQNINLACRGLFSIVPFLARVFERLSTFNVHLIISLVGYGVFLFLMGARRGRFELRFTMRPWHVYVLFTLCLTSIFATLSFGETTLTTSNGQTMVSIRRIIEPSNKVYPNIKDEALAALTGNFTALKDRGCLQEIGVYAGIAPAYKLKGTCIFGSYVSRVLRQLLFLSILALELLVLGRLLLTRARVRIERPLIEAMFCFGIGAGTMIAVLWTLAVFKILIAPVGWAIAVAIPVIGYKHLRYWWQHFTKSGVDVNRKWYDPTVLLFWLLISYLALNFLNVIRPFPIGWDDLGSYINRPRLMVSYGAFIHSMAPFMWEYLSSLGFLLFGYDSVHGATASMMINWLAGPFAVLTVFIMANYFLGKGRGILAAMLYYFLPLVGHFSFADMKIDNAVFAMGALSMFAMFLFIFDRSEENSDQGKLWWLALSGLMAGFAFSTKATAVMIILANGALLITAYFGGLSFFAAAAAALGLLAKRNLFDIAKATERVYGEVLISNNTFTLIMIAIAVLILFLAARQRLGQLKMMGKSIAVLGLFTLIPITPWLLHNNYLVGNIIPKLEMGAPNTLTPQFDIGGLSEPGTKNVRSLPPDLAVDMTHESCNPTGHIEELDRYWGYSKSWSHYFTLPWRTTMNLDSAGYYVTTSPILLLFPLLLLLPFFWLKSGRWLRLLFLATIFILLQWVFVANGIPWYGIGVFLGLVIGIEALLVKAPDLMSKWVLSGLLTMAVLIMFSNRLWQFETQRNLFEYPMGKVNHETLRERTIPHYDNIRDLVTKRSQEMPDRPYMYRVGTFIPYFIPRNLEVIGIADHQLDTFNCLFQERDVALTTRRLRSLGFNSIIFDTNTPTIERDPNGSLHQKVNTFVGFLNNPTTGAQIVINDPAAGVAFVLLN